MITQLPAIVAASGLSTRMGRPKALLETNEGTFLAKIMKSLREGGAGPLLIALRKSQGPLAEEVERNGGTPVLNTHPDPGPISSLQAGLRALPKDATGVIFSPVDHPLFQAGTVRGLMEAFFTSGALLVAPAFGGRRGHPVIFGAALFPELLEPELPEGARSVVRRYLDRRVVVEVPDPGIIIDINTPEDLQRHFP